MQPRLDRVYGNNTDYYVFRRRAVAARWKEEVDLLEEEMRRTVCFFSFYQGKWERESGARETRGDAGGAAYGSRQPRFALRDDD